MRPRGPLVGAEWLADRLGDPGLVVADVRWSLADGAKRDAFAAGHVPGAVFVDLDHVLAGPPEQGPGRHPLPAPDAFAAAMAGLGVGDDDLVVAYDDAGGAYAARLWWMLHRTGHAAAVLDGGLPAWDGPLEGGAGTPRPPATFTARPWPAGEVLDAGAVAATVAGGGVLLDARDHERYTGAKEPVDPRPGHIPGARNAPFAENLHPGTGRFRTAADLRLRYRALGVERGADVVVYCGSGVTACHDLLALEVAGLGAGRLYEGSWSDWSSNADRPAATGVDG